MEESDSDATVDEDVVVASLAAMSEITPRGASKRRVAANREVDQHESAAPIAANPGEDGSNFSLATAAEYSLAELGPWRKDRVSRSEVPGMESTEVYTAPDPFAPGARVSCVIHIESFTRDRLVGYYNDTLEPIRFAGADMGSNNPPSFDKTLTPDRQVALMRKKWVRRSKRWQKWKC